MFKPSISNSPCDFIVFGALGDLSCRKLLPALYQLERADLLHPETQIIGCARECLTRADYLNLTKNKIQSFLTTAIDESLWHRFSAKLTYVQMDLSVLEDYIKLQNYVSDKTAIAYCAIPAFLYANICRGLSLAGIIKDKTRIVLEKPIGHDLPSSIGINNEVAEFFSEKQIYRIDHYLGKETVLNLLVLRFANAIFSSNWDSRFIEKIEITVAEEIGVEGRWNYYDKSGQVRDMLQNHVLQILSLVAMEPPLSLSSEDIRSEKLKVLKSLKAIETSNIEEHVLLAQYGSDNKSLLGYLEEEGANPNSKTETFVAIKAFIDNWRWSGVPFYLLTGKRLAKKQSEVVISFKKQAHNIFGHQKNTLSPNQFIIRLQPDEGLELRMMNKVPGLGETLDLNESKLDLSFNKLFNTPRIADAYERLLLEVMLGHQYLFVSREEIEYAWKWIDGIKNSWETKACPLYSYSSGSWGPDEVNILFQTIND